MAIYKKKYSHNIPSGDKGNRVVFVNEADVSVALVAADKVRPVLIPAGTKVDRVVIKNGILDSGSDTLTAKIGFEHVDGSTGGDDAIVAVTGANALIAAATTTYELFPPYTADKDSHLVITCVVGANAMAAATTVHAKVEGEALGVK